MERGWRSGARPIDHPTAVSDFADPRNGCFNGCGEARVWMLRTYVLTYKGKPVGRWLLCRDCFEWGQGTPGLDPDPLYAEAV